MVLYLCECCNFSSNFKGDYNRHLKTKKHLDNIENSLIPMVMTTNDHKMTTNDHKMTTKNLKYSCDFCDSSFSTKPHKRRHEIHFCKENNSIIKSKINTLEKEKKKLEKEIGKLIDKVGNTTINHIQSNQNNQQNIKLNNYGDEDLSHITDFFKTNLLGLPHGMIPKMIEAVHFNEDKPENKNILLPNKKDNKVKIFSDDKWVYKDKNETLNDLIDGKYFIMDTHYESVCDTTNKNMNLYKRFQELFDERNKILLDAQKK